MTKIETQDIFSWQRNNPRNDKWHEHFKLDGSRIVGLTDTGEVTVKILRLNDDERLLERQILQSEKRYPSAAAIRRLAGAP